MTTHHQLTRLRLALAAHAVTTFAGTTAFKVVATYSAIDFGFSASELGLLAASFGVPPLFVAFHAGRWTDRTGGLKVILIGDVIMVLAALVPVLLSTSVALIAAAAVLGLGSLLSIVGQHALIGATVPKQDQERVFGTMFSANAIGQMLGPLAATVLASLFAGQPGGTLSVHSGFLVAIGLVSIGVATLALFPPAAWRQNRDEWSEPQSALSTIRAILSVNGAAAILCYSAVLVAIIDMLSILLPAWGAERGVAPAVVGVLLSLRAGASIVVRFALVPILTFLGRRNVLIGAAVITASSLAGLTVANLPTAGAIAIALGAALGLAPPISLAWVSLTMPARLRGSAMGLRILANRTAQVGVPAAVGVVSAGLSGMFLVSAGLVVVASVLVFRVPFPDRDGG